MLATVPVSSIETNPSGTFFDDTVEVTSITAGGLLFSNLIGPTDAVLDNVPPDTFDFMWGADGAAVEPLTPLDAVGGLDLSTGVLNPGDTNQGSVNVTFPQTITNLNGTGSDLFIFNPDGALSETWSVQAIVGGTAAAPVLGGTAVNFTGADMGDTGININHQRNSGGNFNQDERAIGIDLADLGVASLIGLQITTPDGDPTAIVANVGAADFADDSVSAVTTANDSGLTNLTSVTTGRGTIDAADLIGIDVNHWHAPSSGNTVLSVGAADPGAGNRASLIDGDLALNTGMINPADAGALSPAQQATIGPANSTINGLGVTFDGGVINGPGVDVIVFEYADPGAQDHIRVNRVDGVAGDLVIAPGDYSVSGSNLPTRLVTPNSSSLNNFESSGTWNDTGGVTQGWYAAGIDLSDLGYSAGATVNGLFFSDGPGTGNADIVLIRGLPVLNAVDDSFATNENSSLGSSPASVLDNDFAPPGMALFSSDAVSANGAAVSMNPDGTFTYDPTGSTAIQALDEGQVLSDTFTYTITDDPNPAVQYVESGGQVVGEGEVFTDRTGSGAKDWKIVGGPNDETVSGDNDDPLSNARDGSYVQLLPDGGGGSGGPLNNPEILYEMVITTPGTYRLFTRWGANATNVGASDSLFADIVELKDGTGGAIADWYEMAGNGGTNFARNFGGCNTTSGWDGCGGNELNTAGGGDDPMTWDISTPGTYTLRFTEREDGAAVDAWVFQLDSLPAPDGTGPATSDLAGNFDTATVTVQVTGANDAPVANDDANTMTEALDGVPAPNEAMGNVLANDTDADDPNSSFTVSAVNGNAGDVGMSVTGNYGSVVINSDGSYTYTLDDANPTVNGLTFGDTLVDSFDYTVNDNHSGGSPMTDTGTLNITIEGVNDSPIATNNTANVVEDTSPADSGNLISDDDGDGVDSDPEGDTIRVGEIDGTTDPGTDVAGTYGSLDWETDGSYTYTLGPAAQALSAGQMETETFTYTLQTLGVGATATIVEYQFGDGDPDVEGAGVTASAVTESGALNTFDPNFDGSYSTQPVLRIGVPNNNTNTEAEAVANDSYFEFTITPANPISLEELSFDAGRGGGSTARGFALRSSIDGFSTTLLTDPTVDTQRPNFTNYAADLTAFSPDFENLASPVTFRIYAFTPSTGNTLEFDNLIVTGASTNAVSGTDTATLTVTVTGTNDAPVADDDSASVDEDATVTIDVLDGDTDVDLNDTLTVSGVNGTNASSYSRYGAAISVVGNMVNYDPTNAAALQVLRDGESIMDSFTYTVDDGNGGTDVGTVTVTVTSSDGVEINTSFDHVFEPFAALPGTPVTLSGSETILLTVDGATMDVDIGGMRLRTDADISAAVAIDAVGGAGNTLWIDDTADADADASASIDSDSIDGVIDTGSVVSHSGIGAVAVDSTDFDDTFDLNSLAGGAMTSVTVNGNAGEDTFVTTPQAVTVNVNGNSPVLPADPGDTLVLDLTAEPVPLVVPTTVDGTFDSSNAANAPVNWLSVENFIINGEVVPANRLFVEATTGSDRIIFFPTNGDAFRVRINNEYFPATGAFDATAIEVIEAVGREGSDRIIVAGRLDIPVEFDGGAGNDYLAGGTNDDTLIGGIGNDIILGGEGNNVLSGGVGSDRLEGRDGDDIIFGGDGTDRLVGNGGNDILDGGNDSDFLFGGLGDDLLVGRAGIDTLQGHYGNDVIFGGDDADQLFGGYDDDILFGGAGADRLRGDVGNDDVIGGNSSIEGDLEAALDAMLATLGTDLATADPTVNAAVTAWQTTGTDRSGFGTLINDNTVDDLTGGNGIDPNVVDEFHSADDNIRDLRVSEGDSMIP